MEKTDGLKTVSPIITGPFSDLFRGNLFVLLNSLFLWLQPYGKVTSGHSKGLSKNHGPRTYTCMFLVVCEPWVTGSVRISRWTSIFSVIVLFFWCIFPKENYRSLLILCYVTDVGTFSLSHDNFPCDSPVLVRELLILRLSPLTFKSSVFSTISTLWDGLIFCFSLYLLKFFLLF